MSAHTKGCVANEQRDQVTQVNSQVIPGARAMLSTMFKFDQEDLLVLLEGLKETDANPGLLDLPHIFLHI